MLNKAEILLLINGFINPTGYAVDDVSKGAVSQSGSQSAQKSCIDSDGRNYGIKGNVNYCKDGECATKYDSCSGKTMIELLCENEEIKSEEYLCEFDCDSGVCVNKITTIRYSGSGGGSSGGGGDGGTLSSESSIVSEVGQMYDLVILDSEKSIEAVNNDIIKFTLSGLQYNMVIQSLSQTQVTLAINSLPSITLDVGKTKSVDLNSDGNSDLSIKVKSINVISNKVKLFFTP